MGAPESRGEKDAAAADSVAPTRPSLRSGNNKVLCAVRLWGIDTRVSRIIMGLRFSYLYFCRVQCLSCINYSCTQRQNVIDIYAKGKLRAIYIYFFYMRHLRSALCVCAVLYTLDYRVVF